MEKPITGMTMTKKYPRRFYQINHSIINLLQRDMNTKYVNEIPSVRHEILSAKCLWKDDIYRNNSSHIVGYLGETSIVKGTIRMLAAVFHVAHLNKILSSAVPY